MSKDTALWVFALLLLLTACGKSAYEETSVPVVSAVENTPIVYHQIDTNTTTFAPDVHMPIVCYYVESMKAPRIVEWPASTYSAATSAVYTSGLSCIMVTQEQFDNYLERYPQ